MITLLASEAASVSRQASTVGRTLSASRARPIGDAAPRRPAERSATFRQSPV
jgi:hypothetical protein